MLTDTDHYAPGAGDALWAWKSFLRDHNPILMDFGIIDVVHPLDPSHGVPPTSPLEPARYAMGDTLRFAQQMPLTAMRLLLIRRSPGCLYLGRAPASISERGAV